MHLVTARIVKVACVRGLCADDRELYLELVKHIKRFVEFSINIWHVSAEGVLVRAAVVALEKFHV